MNKMHEIELDQVGKAYNRTEVLRSIECDVCAGEFLVLVGPSGCGKSTLLRMIGGLEDIDSGEVRMEGRRLNDVKPRERDMAMVFQNYALYPHLTVEENIAFPLMLRRVPKADRAEHVAKVAKAIGLGGLLNRKPAELSGGQRQRVAIGRAIVREPKVFLMDEPLSNLDAKLRVEMRSELRSLHSRLGITTVYVTHDQTEAMTLGTRVAVLRPLYEALSTNLQQIASPEELYQRPANVFVAGFIGSPSMNLLLGTVEQIEGSIVVRMGSSVIRGNDLSPARLDRLRELLGKQVIVGVRPSEFLVDDTNGGIVGSVRDTELLGDDIAVQLTVDATVVPYDFRFEQGDLGSLSSVSKLVARLPLAARRSNDERIALSIDTDRVKFFDARTGMNLEGVS